MKWSENRSAVSDFLWQHGQYSPRNFLGQNTGVGSLSLLLSIFLIQGPKPGLPHYRGILHQLSHSLGQLSSVAQMCLTLCEPMDYSTPGLPVHHWLPAPTQTHVHWVGEAIQPFHPLSPLLFQASILPNIRVFSNESSLRIRWPKYWSFSFSISPSNEYPGLISFRMDWLDLLAIQGTLKSLLQYHSSKASILWLSVSL